MPPRTAPVITALEEFTESINLLAYGDAGAGKTVLGGSEPKTLIIACENGAVAAARQFSKAKLVRVRTWLELENVLKWLQARDRGFTWIAIDSVTAAQELLTTHITGEGFKANPSKREDESTMQLQDYLKRDVSTKKMINAFNDLPINVLWLAREIQEENEDGDIVTRPAISGKMGTNDAAAMSRWLCGSVHAYGHLVVRTNKETREEFRRLVFKRPYGKDRYGVLGPYIDNPTIPEIERRILLPVTPPRRRRTSKEREQVNA